MRVARDRDPGVTVEQIAKDCGVHPMTLCTWLRQADIDAGTRPGVSGSDQLGDYASASKIRSMVTAPSRCTSVFSQGDQG